MKLKGGAVLCYCIALLQIASTYPSCPDYCYCDFDFTDCKFLNLSRLPAGFDNNITSLDLSHNAFDKFPEDLNRYRNLVYLNLSHNRISVLDNSALAKLKRLERLDFSFNSFSDWMDIRSYAFAAAKNLIFLDFSYNPLRSIPADSYPLRINSLEVLRLNNCSVRSLNSNIFRTMPNLKELHLSQNPLTYLNVSFSSAALKFLDLSRCNLKHISQYAIANLTALETIWLYQNINLKKFSCVSNSLLYLDLSDCNLELVPGGPLPRVYSANFHGNHFRIIPRGSFVNYTSLRTLDLSYNAISVIEENAFHGLDDVESIDLSLNTLSDLNPNLFYSNGRLQKLNLSRNYFSRVEAFAIKSLEVLDLSSCEIQSVRKGSLLDMPNLKEVNLTRNVLSALPDYLQGANLEVLNVSFCRIKNVNNKTFATMPSLRRLDLSGNRLTTVYPECFAQVTSLDIDDNPWRCECSKLKDMYIWLSRTGKRVDTLICQSPEVYEGWSWYTACQNSWHPELTNRTSVWWYTTGLIVGVFVILFVILTMRKMYMLKEKRMREADEARRAEERETLRRMRRMQLEAREEASRNAPDPRELQTPPSYNEALLLPRLDASHPSLSGSLHSIASKHSLHGSNPDVTSKKGRPRRKRRRRKSDSSEGQRASRIAVDSDTATSDHDRPQPRLTLESDF